jgi:xylan 1,4-beta-xylosidase
VEAYPMTADSSKEAQIRVDAGIWLGVLAHNWNYIGYDEINYTYVPEGQELLAKFMELQEKPYYIRPHHLLCTGNCHGFYKWGSTNAYLEDDEGGPIYDWTVVDQVFDTILNFRCKPFVEIGFMPQDLVDPAHYEIAKDGWTAQQYRTHGWACPPKDYHKWYDLVFNLVRHCGERYGQGEIAGWYWELWNEPDIFYWQGSIDEFNKLYDYTAAAVKAACPAARVGGPATTNPVPGRKSAEFLDAFLDHCANGTNYYSGETGAALDFITFHVKGGGYRADPKHRKQNPPSVKQIVSNTRTGYEIISKYPAFKDLECILSEIDPDGWAAGGAWDNINLNFRNTEYYASFVAAAFDKVSKFAKGESWDLKLLTWAFMFVGERCFEGTRTFSTQGIDKAILNLFRMYARMGTQEVAFESSAVKDPLSYADLNGRGEAPDISGFATLSSKGLQVLIYNHHDDWDLSDEYAIELEIANLPFDAAELVMTHERIDQAHSNAYAEWVRQNRPTYPAPGQRAAIKAREGLEMLEPPRTVATDDGKIKLSFNLPIHGISLLCITPRA